MLKTGKDFDFPQRSLAIGLVLERGDLLDCHLCLCDAIEGGSGREGRDETRNYNFEY